MKKPTTKKLKIGADTLRRLTVELSQVRGAFQRPDTGSFPCQTNAIGTCPN